VRSIGARGVAGVYAWGMAWGSLTWMPVALGSPGATATTWTAGWAGGTSGGASFVQVRVTDTAGNQDAVHSSSRFTEV